MRKLWHTDDKDEGLFKNLSVCERIESEDDPLPLRPNPIVAQMKIYEDEKSKKPKALICLYSSLLGVIFTRIMACSTPEKVQRSSMEVIEGRLSNS